MGLITKQYTYQSGAIILASEQNANEDALYTLVNGQIDNANISATAAISATKLATIATAGKVSGASLTALTTIPSAAGIIPIANLPIGRSANQIVTVSGTNNVLPALDGSLLTGISIGTGGTIDSASLGTGSASASNFLRGDRTWAAVSTGAPVTSSFLAGSVSKYTSVTANVVSLSKTVTSGNTVYINASGYVNANTTILTTHTFILYAGATSVHTVKVNTPSTFTLTSWATNAIVAGLSGATTIRVQVNSDNGYQNDAYGNLSVLEF